MDDAKIVQRLLNVARAAYRAADDSEELLTEDGSEHRISTADFEDLSEALDALEELPDDKPGYTLNGPGRAEWALRNFLSAQPQKGKEVSFDLKTAMSGAQAFFEGEYFWLMGIVDSSKVKGQRQEDECRPEFDHCFVEQDGGGITGDDFHGCVYFHIGGGEYLKASY